MKNTLLKAITLGPLVLLIGYSTVSAQVDDAPDQRSNSKTAPVRVSASQDLLNITVLESTTPAIIVTIEIDGSEVRLSSARVMRAPISGQRAKVGPALSFLAYDGGDVVGKTTVSDPIIKLQEGVGIVMLKKRSVTAAVPMSRPAGSIEVHSSEDYFAVQRFDISDIMNRYCGDYERSKLCAAGRPTPNVQQPSTRPVRPKGTKPKAAIETNPAPVTKTNWTDWLNRDAPGGTGDFEDIKGFVAAGQACENPTAIECRTRDGVDWQKAGQEYTCNIDTGGVCRNQGQRCMDYEVRFQCPAAERAVD